MIQKGIRRIRIYPIVDSEILDTDSNLDQETESVANEETKSSEE